MRSFPITQFFHVWIATRQNFIVLFVHSTLYVPEIHVTRATIALLQFPSLLLEISARPTIQARNDWKLIGFITSYLKKLWFSLIIASSHSATADWKLTGWSREARIDNTSCQFKSFFITSQLFFSSDFKSVFKANKSLLFLLLIVCLSVCVRPIRLSICLSDRILSQHSFIALLCTSTLQLHFQMAIYSFYA